MQPYNQGPMAPQNPYAMQQTQCASCQRVAPTKHVTFMQNIGCIVIRFPKRVSGQLCKRCIDSYFWRMTTITFFFGWWGIISFFYSLVSIPQNIAQWLGSRSLPDA